MNKEVHLVGRAGWLRAAVLGANDGIISTASLILGVASVAASASASRQDAVIAGFAGLVAGAMSMAAGEFVSVSSQSDTENADLARERIELAATPEAETRELADIYVGRGVEATLARQVAEQLMAHDALEAHARDELGISATTRARPVQAALASAASFTAGAAAPLALAYFAPGGLLRAFVAAGSLIFLAVLGALGARAGGAGLARPMLRVTFWGALAMGITAAIGALFGRVV
jgi:VIT1/CCC1 family predicted Fe2+/Mn2+ transporter